MRSILQLCVMVLMLLGAGNRVWGKVAVGQNIAVRGFAEGGAFGNEVDEPPALMSSGEAAAWGYDCTVDVRDGPNVYAYVMQNPWGHWDPNGLLTMGEVGSFTLGMAKSYAGAVVAPFVAPYQSMLHPVDSATGVKNLVVHPVDSVKGAVKGVKDTWNSGPEGKGEIVMDGIIAVASVRQAFKGWKGSSSPKTPVTEAPALAPKPSPPTPGGQSAQVTGEVAMAEAEAAAPPVAPGQTMSPYPQGRRVGGKGESPRPTDPPTGTREAGAWDPTPENLARMEQGKPPIGRDGMPVELHHRHQNPAGPLDQMTSTTHDTIPHPLTPSRIDRSKFSGERSRNWRGEARKLNGQQ